MDDNEADMGDEHEEYTNVNTRDTMNRMMDDEDDNGEDVAQDLAAAGLEDSDVEDEAVRFPFLFTPQYINVTTLPWLPVRLFFFTCIYLCPVRVSISFV